MGGALCLNAVRERPLEAGRMGQAQGITGREGSWGHGGKAEGHPPMAPFLQGVQRLGEREGISK